MDCCIVVGFAECVLELAVRILEACRECIGSLLSL